MNKYDKKLIFVDFCIKSSIFMTHFAPFFSVSLYLYSFLSYFTNFLYQFAVKHHLQSDIRDVPGRPGRPFPYAPGGRGIGLENAELDKPRGPRSE